MININVRSTDKNISTEAQQVIANYLMNSKLIGIRNYSITNTESIVRFRLHNLIYEPSVNTLTVFVKRVTGI